MNRMYESFVASFNPGSEVYAQHIRRDRLKRFQERSQVNLCGNMFITDDDNRTSLRSGMIQELKFPGYGWRRLTDQFSASLPLSPKGRVILNSMAHSLGMSRSGVRFVRTLLPYLFR